MSSMTDEELAKVEKWVEDAPRDAEVAYVIMPAGPIGDRVGDPMGTLTMHIRTEPEAEYITCGDLLALCAALREARAEIKAYRHALEIIADNMEVLLKPYMQEGAVLLSIIRSTLTHAQLTLKDAPEFAKMEVEDAARALPGEEGGDE